METMVSLAVVSVIALAQLIAILVILRRPAPNVDLDHATSIFKEMHASWQAGRVFGAAEQQVGALDTQWSGPAMNRPLKDEVPYDEEQEARDREPEDMPDGTPSVVDVTEAPSQR